MNIVTSEIGFKHFVMHDQCSVPKCLYGVDDFFIFFILKMFSESLLLSVILLEN